MKKIAVVGIMGAGKSTFAGKLGRLLHLEVIHLDKEFWLPGWKEKYSPKEWEEFQKQLVKKEEWIIDGNYRDTIDIRLEAADTIIYFDLPKIKALYRVIKRSFSRAQSPDKALGVKERLSWYIIKFLLIFPKKEMKQKMAYYQNTKKVVVFKNDGDVHEFLRLISR